MMNQIFAKKVLLADGWAKDQLITIEHGVISKIEKAQVTSVNADCVKSIVIPGMVNCHSHAFQRAFAGFSEQGSESNDSFWTWRAIMYKFLDQLTSEDAELIATQLYIEMVKMGYTRVAEFHYLHHQVGGDAYEPLSTMAKAIFNAAKQSGIGLTLLPVLYRHSGFGEQTPNEGQARFINSVEQFNRLVSDCFDLSAEYENTNVGIAPHSLRAVDQASLLNAVEHVRRLDPTAPIHIHIAEQQKEVNDCLNYYQKRPVQWLIDNVNLDQHWCLIHATHIDENERQGIVKSGAIAGICPTTEANLGDGIFPMQEFVSEGGTWAIGSDSHISVSPVEELRWLEYGQRLIKQQRAILATDEQKSVGRHMWEQAAIGGAQSCSQKTGQIAPGMQADFIVIDEEKLGAYAHSEQHLLDSLVFATHASLVKDVMINGHWVVNNYEHALAKETHQAFSQLLGRLSA